MPNDIYLALINKGKIKPSTALGLKSKTFERDPQFWAARTPNLNVRSERMHADLSPLRAYDMSPKNREILMAIAGLGMDVAPLLGAARAVRAIAPIAGQATEMAPLYERPTAMLMKRLEPKTVSIPRGELRQYIAETRLADVATPNMIKKMAEAQGGTASREMPQELMDSLLRSLNEPTQPPKKISTTEPTSVGGKPKKKE